jgi:hypothetical protein
MTAYRDRLNAGDYDASSSSAAPVLRDLRRKELVTIADQRGLPTYGTREQLLERLERSPET